VERGCGLEADPAAFSETQQSTSEASPVGVRRTAQRIDPWGEAEHPTISDETSLGPRRDAVRSQLFDRDESVLVGGMVAQ
jgi:hypothetical protein